MSTLPATIPGLVRFCTPLCFRDEETPWVATGCGPIEGGDPAFLLVTATPRSAFGLAITAGAEDFEVDLADPTGIDHAARYAAETICKKIGWPEPASVMAVHQPRMLVGLWLSMSFAGGTVRQVYFFTRPNGGDRLMDSSLNDGIPTYCTCAVDVSRAPSLAEALRLAVLAVAGVQG